ncbi:MAG TPA: hypothetical protein PKC49_05410 [Phycisphaerae bacterium]|nr:hypothetical protein [Phycisphaerae bacterium]
MAHCRQCLSEAPFRAAGAAAGVLPPSPPAAVGAAAIRAWCPRGLSPVADLAYVPRRRAACDACPDYVDSGCRHLAGNSGCATQRGAALATALADRRAACPAGRWPAEEEEERRGVVVNSWPSTDEEIDALLSDPVRSDPYTDAERAARVKAVLDAGGKRTAQDGGQLSPLRGGERSQP